MFFAVFVALAGSWRLAGPSLWLDEASTWGISGHGFDDLARALVHSEGDAGALYLVIAHGWLRVWGDSEFALRSLSVICAVATIPLFFAVARRLLDRRSALVASGLLAVNPFFIEYSREARMYALALLLCVVASYCFVRLVSGGRGGWWVLYGLAASAAMYAHAFSVLVIVAHASSLLALQRRSVNWRRITGAFVLTFVLTLPLCAYVVITSGRGVDWIKPLSLEQVRVLAVNITGTTPSIAPVFVLVVAAVAGSCVWAALRRGGRSWDLWAAAFPLLWWLLPIAVTAAVSSVKPFFVSRYLFVALPGYVLTLGILYQWLRYHARVLGVVAIVAATAISYPAIDQIWGAGMRRENWRAAESYVAANYQPGDAIAIPISRVQPFGYYAKDDPRLSVTHPLAALPAGPWTVPYTPAPNHHLPTRTPRIPTTGTLWIVVRRPNAAAGLRNRWRTPTLDAIRRAIRTQPGHTPTRTFPGIVVYHYTGGAPTAQRKHRQR